MRELWKETKRDRERETERETERSKDRETERDREIDRVEREREHAHKPRLTGIENQTDRLTICWTGLYDEKLAVRVSLQSTFARACVFLFVLFQYIFV